MQMKKLCNVGANQHCGSRCSRCLKHWCLIWTPIHLPAASLSVQFLAKHLGKWHTPVPASHVGTPQQFLASLYPTWPAAGIWEARQQMEDLSLCPACLCYSFKRNKWVFKNKIWNSWDIMTFVLGILFSSFLQCILWNYSIEFLHVFFINLF